MKTDALTAGYAERFLLREPTYGGAARRLQSYGVRNADSTLVAETIAYDAEGNRTRYRTTAADDYFVDIEMMYDAVGQLRFVDRRICKMTSVDAAAGVGSRGCVGDPDQTGSVQDSVFRDQSVFQEYLYDALGRRVLIHSRASDTQCGASNCPNYIERVVWDGDQILFEARYPSVDLAAAGGGTIVADLGTISGTVDVSDGLHPFGVVGYVHGAAIDKPYIVERQYHNPADANEVLYSYAIEDGLGAEVTPADDDGDPDTQECLDTVDTVDGDCHGVEWELWEPWPSLEKRPTGRVLTEGPSYWMGSLGEDGEDPTGLLYRRNRYYDPLAGQFTQEDPIGLAGGLNVYGFANNDPVNFRDPFGLMAEDQERTECEPGVSIFLCDSPEARKLLRESGLNPDFVPDCGRLLRLVEPFCDDPYAVYWGGSGILGSASPGGLGRGVVRGIAGTRIGRLFGLPNPVRPGYMRQLQPFDASTGRWLSFSANPGQQFLRTLPISPLAQDVNNLTSGFYSGYTLTPAGSMGTTRRGVVLNWMGRALGWFFRQGGR